MLEWSQADVHCRQSNETGINFINFLGKIKENKHSVLVFNKSMGRIRSITRSARRLLLKRQFLLKNILFLELNSLHFFSFSNKTLLIVSSFIRFSTENFPICFSSENATTSLCREFYDHFNCLWQNLIMPYYVKWYNVPNGKLVVLSSLKNLSIYNIQINTRNERSRSTRTVAFLPTLYGHNCF